MFLHVSVCPQGGVHGQVPPDRYAPRAGTPPYRYTPGWYTPRHSACWDNVNNQAVRIPLECILVQVNVLLLRITPEQPVFGEARSLEKLAQGYRSRKLNHP